MADKLSNVTYEIATAQAWKVFGALLACSGLMLILIATTRLGFALFAMIMFGWLSAVAVELAKANGKVARAPGSAGVLGLAFCLAFTFYDNLHFVVPEAVGAFYLPLSGLGFLACMLYLMLYIGPLLAKLEASAGKAPGTNASLLVWMWPVGIWFLQPRLRQVLRRQPAA